MDRRCAVRGEGIECSNII